MNTQRGAPRASVRTRWAAHGNSNKSGVPHLLRGKLSCSCDSCRPQFCHSLMCKNHGKVGGSLRLFWATLRNGFQRCFVIVEHLLWWFLGENSIFPRFNPKDESMESTFAKHQALLESPCTFVESNASAGPIWNWQMQITELVEMHYQFIYVGHRYSSQQQGPGIAFLSFLFSSHLFRTASVVKIIQAQGDFTASIFQKLCCWCPLGLVLSTIRMVIGPTNIVKNQESIHLKDEPQNTFMAAFAKMDLMELNTRAKKKGFGTVWCLPKLWRLIQANIFGQCVKNQKLMFVKQTPCSLGFLVYLSYIYIYMYR